MGLLVGATMKVKIDQILINGLTKKFLLKGIEHYN
jgi:hypothetical protein